MDGVDIIHIKEWQPFTRFNITHPFFTLNANTIIYTWIALISLLFLGLFVRYILPYKRSPMRFILLSVMRSLLDMITQTIGYFSYRHCTFIISLFLFIFLCNITALLPFVEEATKDLNTTFALGIISFLYVQTNAIATHGIIEYLKEFTAPVFLMAPLHVISKLSTIVSMSFRLFGNIFGSGIILKIYYILLESSIVFQLFGIITGLNLLLTLFFVLFEGFLQAFVFTMLALTYLGIAIAQEHGKSPEKKHG